MESLFSAMPSWLSFIIMVGGSAILVWVATVLIHSRIKGPEDKTYNEVTGLVFVAVSAIYAVLIAFLIFTVWGEFQGAERAAREEAAAVIAVARTTASFPEPARQEVHDRLYEYTQIVSNEEWQPTYQNSFEDFNGGNPHALSMLNEIWDIYRSLPPTAVNTEITRTLNNFGEKRALRLFETSETFVPGQIWTLLWLGAAVTICPCLILHMKNIRLHATLAALLTGLILANLWLIMKINNPLAGDLHITPYAFNIARRVIDSLPR